MRIVRRALWRFCGSPWREATADLRTVSHGGTFQGGDGCGARFRPSSSGELISEGADIEAARVNE